MDKIAVMRGNRHLIVLLLAATLAGCASPDIASCPAGLRGMTKAELFFGRAIPGGGQVNEDDWRRFVDEEVTPRFPDGLTIQDSVGQWKDPSGIVREPSKLVTVVFADAAEPKLTAIRVAYRKRFHQDSVLLIEQHVCAGF